MGIGVGGGCLVGLLGETLISPLCVNGPLLSCEWHLHIQYIIHSRGHERTIARKMNRECKDIEKREIEI